MKIIKKLKELHLRIIKLRTYSKGYKQLKKHLNTRYERWNELPGKRFVAGNLTIYFRKEYNEWRITADGLGLFDIATIDYPFTDESWETLHWAASSYYKIN